MHPQGTYTAQARDTSREADEMLFHLYRAAGPLGRLRKAGAIGASLTGLALDALRARFPGEADQRLRIRLAARSIARSDLLAAFGWAPPAEDCARP